MLKKVKVPSSIGRTVPYIVSTGEISIKIQYKNNLTEKIVTEMSHPQAYLLSFIRAWGFEKIKLTVQIVHT